MITEQEAERLAQKAMQDYVASCGCNTAQEVGAVLVKLVSTCGVGMCATVGTATAVKNIEDAAAYIGQTQGGKKWRQASVH
jgi:hypothetical protein